MFLPAEKQDFMFIGSDPVGSFRFVCKGATVSKSFFSICYSDSSMYSVFPFSSTALDLVLHIFHAKQRLVSILHPPALHTFRRRRTRPPLGPQQSNLSPVGHRTHIPEPACHNPLADHPSLAPIHFFLIQILPRHLQRLPLFHPAD